jgi:hypothetical protein
LLILQFQQEFFQNSHRFCWHLKIGGYEEQHVLLIKQYTSDSLLICKYRAFFINDAIEIQACSNPSPIRAYISTTDLTGSIIQLLYGFRVWIRSSKQGNHKVIVL